MGNVKPNKRDQILDALQQILVSKGPSAVTLEAVAARAGVSKGGLLYHFNTKRDLYDGLAKRLRQSEEEEFVKARELGIVEGFLRSSVTECSEGAAGYWALLTAMQGSREDLSEEALADVNYVFNQWSVLLEEEITDPTLAGIIRLVGDGLFLTAVSGLPQPSPELLEEVIKRLVEQSQAEPQ